jgi:hypothetical protein
MELKEALTFWANASEIQGDEPIVIDAESVPGWVIALRRPHGRAPYVEIWWEGDFIEETRIHQSADPKRAA